MYNLCDINTIKKITKENNFHFSKGLGQNFLINPDICPMIASLGIDSPKNGVIEIGTGFGVLTAELAKKSQKVVAIEIDKSLLPILDKTLSDFSNIKIINSDVLKIDLKKLIEDEFDGMDVQVCANLPYYITSPIVMGLLEQQLPIKSITVMVQKETAIRLCAKPGTRECSAITFGVNYYSNPSILFDVMRDSFIPSPNVDSAVIKLDIREQKPQGVIDEDFLFKVVKMSFSQRRKTIANPLSSSLNIKKDILLNILKIIGLKPTVRAEELIIDDFINLSNSLYKIIHGDSI